MIVSAPMDEEELRNLMYTAQLPNKGPFSIRYPRGEGVLPEWRTKLKAIKIGTGRMIKDGSGLAILSIGHVGNLVVNAQKDLEKEGFDIAHFDMRFVKPLDEKLLHQIFQNFQKVITIEDGCLQAGFGSAIIEFMTDNNYKLDIVRLGIPDEFINHGTQDELYAQCFFDTKAIRKAVYRIMESKSQAAI